MRASDLMQAASLYQSAKPFPHIVIPEFLSRETVQAINNDWPNSWEAEMGNKCRIKKATRAINPAAQKVVDELSSPLFCEQLSLLTGIMGLQPDPELEGGGFHCIERGGYLKTHVDFNATERPEGNLYRRVNILIYLNLEWREEWEGHLYLGENAQVRVSPDCGTLAMFSTSDVSWHGHPIPLACPKGVQRRSLALYYYTTYPPSWYNKRHSTIYRLEQ